MGPYKNLSFVFWIFYCICISTWNKGTTFFLLHQNDFPIFSDFHLHKNRGLSFWYSSYTFLAWCRNNHFSILNWLWLRPKDMKMFLFSNISAIVLKLRLESPKLNTRIYFCLSLSSPSSSSSGDISVYLCISLLIHWFNHYLMIFSWFFNYLTSCNFI